MFNTILTAVDGSHHALKAAKMAGEIARLFNASLRLVVVYPPIPSYIGEPTFQQILSGRIAEAERVMASAVAEIGEVPGGLETELLEGQPAEAILNAAEVWKNDLIVMGSRGLGRLTGLFLGSQSQKVLSHAPCPVLIVR